MRWEKNQPPNTRSFFFEQDLNVGYFMVIVTYNLLSWELNFTNTKANLKMFFPDREYTRLQRAESVIHSSGDLSLFMVIKEGRWDKQISVI